MGCISTTDKKKDKPPASPRQSDNKLQKYKVSENEKKDENQFSMSLKNIGNSLQLFNFDNKPLSLIDYYRHPYLLVKLYVQRPNEFMFFIMKHPQIDLTRFTGYECMPEIILKSRRSVSTYFWNVFTFALVREDESLYKFLLKSDIGINVGRLVPIQTILINKINRSKVYLLNK